VMFCSSLPALRHQGPPVVPTFQSAQSAKSAARKPQCRRLIRGCCWTTPD